MEVRGGRVGRKRQPVESVGLGSGKNEKVSSWQKLFEGLF